MATTTECDRCNHQGSLQEVSGAVLCLGCCVAELRRLTGDYCPAERTCWITLLAAMKSAGTVVPTCNDGACGP